VHSIDVEHPASHHAAWPGPARVVIACHPHHVTQRGNGGARTFFDDGDDALYHDLLAGHCRALVSSCGPGA
jgi:hypothetical protein